MGTEILRPQDCLTERFGVTPSVFPRRKFVYGNPRPNRKQQQQQPVRQDRQDRQKRLGTTSQSEPSISKRSSSDDLKSTKNNNHHHHHHPVIGQVMLLRRGESLDSKIKSEALVKRKDGDDAVLILSGTERLGPEPESVPNQIRINDLKSFLSPVTVRSDMYAGSAFSVSPSPSSLPLPSFSKKKQVSLLTDDSATRNLRRLLRLD